MRKIAISIFVFLSSTSFAQKTLAFFKSTGNKSSYNSPLVLSNYNVSQTFVANAHTSHAAHTSHFSCFRDSFVANLSEKTQEVVINKILKNENIKIEQGAKNHSYARIKNLYMFPDTVFAQPLKCLYVNLFFFGNSGGAAPFDYTYKFNREYFFPLSESENNVYIHEDWGTEGFKIKHYTIKKKVWMKNLLKNLSNE